MPDYIYRSNKFAELDKAKGAEGNEIDEIQGNRFLESLGTPMTAMELRNTLREIDANNDKKISLVEYLCFTFKGKMTVNELVHAPQGNKEEVNKALELLQSAQAALEAAKSSAEASKEAEETSRASEAAAKDAEATAIALEDEGEEK